jgi:hypothetical protein
MTTVLDATLLHAVFPQFEPLGHALVIDSSRRNMMAAIHPIISLLV